MRETDCADAQGLSDNKKAALEGGTVAGNARRELEEKAVQKFQQKRITKKYRKLNARQSSRIKRLNNHERSKNMQYSQKGKGIAVEFKECKAYCGHNPQLLEQDIFKFILPLTGEATQQVTEQAERTTKKLADLDELKNRCCTRRFQENCKLLNP